MAAKSLMKESSDNNVELTLEDQQRINTFAKRNAKLQELKAEIEAKRKELQNIDDASQATEEFFLLEDEGAVSYQVGEVFINMTSEETEDFLSKAKERITKRIETLQTQVGDTEQVLKDLKVKLYAKFGTNINLEADEE